MRIRKVTASCTLDDIDMLGTKIICESTSIISLTLPSSVSLKDGADSEIDNIGSGNVSCSGKTIAPQSHAHIVHTGSAWTVALGGGIETDPVFIASAAYGITAADTTNWGTAFSHSQASHAPVDAQKNSDITKGEIEAKLTGIVSSHSHSGGAGDASSLNGVGVPTPTSADDQKYIKYNHATGTYVMGTPTGGGSVAESDWGQL